MLIKMKSVSKGKSFIISKQQPSNRTITCYPRGLRKAPCVGCLIFNANIDYHRRHQYSLIYFSLTNTVYVSKICIVYIIYLIFKYSTTPIAFAKADYIPIFFILLISSKTLSHTVKKPTYVWTQEVLLQRYISKNQNHL